MRYIENLGSIREYCQVVEDFTVHFLRNLKMRILVYNWLTNEVRQDPNSAHWIYAGGTGKDMKLRSLTHKEIIAENLGIPVSHVKFERAYDTGGREIPDRQAVFAKKV